jgi:TorA maturation chaperone TorD
MNEFSMVCRVLGSLFYRQPTDPLLAPLLNLIKEGGLEQHWPLEQEQLLANLQQHCDVDQLTTDFNALFVGNESLVSPLRSRYLPDCHETEIREFLQQQGMPLAQAPADHLGLLLLAASWLEDQPQQDTTAAQIILFDQFILPWCGRFFEQVVVHASSDFYRALAQITEEAITAMRDELAEYTPPV